MGDSQIAPIRKPKKRGKPPKPDKSAKPSKGAKPQTPVAGAGPDADPKETARALAKLLRDQNTHDEALDKAKEIKKAGQLDALETMLLDALRNKADGLAVRRLIRFVRRDPAGPPVMADPKFPRLPTVHTARTDLGVGIVRAYVGLYPKTGGDFIPDGFALEYEGSQAQEMRWLQFIWRQLVAMPRKIPRQRRLVHQDLGYLLTTDLPADPKATRAHWTTDRSDKATPFYEVAIERNANRLAMYDVPDPRGDIAAELFKLVSPSTEVTSRFHAETYLVHGMEVLYRADIDIVWIFTPGRGTPKNPTVTIKGAPTDVLKPEHRARLQFQHPEVDYLPGPLIAAPVPVGDFDMVLNLDLGDWDTRKEMDRYIEVAELAAAELIDDVGVSRRITDNATNTAGDPGLNFTQLTGTDDPSEFATTSFVYGKRLTTTLATDASAAIPKVAMVLRSNSFKKSDPRSPLQTKAFALETVRHEMMHATHAQLAIGWLLKWRDDFTATPFKKWLEQQTISRADRALVSMWLTGERLVSETFAWTESFVSAAPFLPATPTLALMVPPEPAAVRALRRMGDHFVDLASDVASDVQKAVLARVHRVACNALTQTQRDVVVKWISFLLFPDPPAVTGDDEKKAYQLIRNEFSRLGAFVKKVQQEVQRACGR